MIYLINYYYYIKNFILSLIHSDIFKNPITYAKQINEDIDHLRECGKETIKIIKEFRKSLEEEKLKRLTDKLLYMTIIDNVDYMIWAKDLNGKYIVGNKSFRNNYCYGISWEDLKGKTDSDIDKIFKNTVGRDNHTMNFGLDTDNIIKETRERREFLESGKIDGKEVKLLIFKSPVYDTKGSLYAICSSGKDITHFYSDIKSLAQKVFE